MNRDDLIEIASRRRLDLVSADAVVEWAATRLSEGDDEAALVSIAALQSPAIGSDVDPMLDALVVEVGGTPLTLEDAGRGVARHFAQLIVDGAVDPVVGADRLWWDVGARVPAFEQRLRVFDAMASMWDEDESRRSEYEADIVAEARQLLNDLL